MSREEKIEFLIQDDIEYIMQTMDGKNYLRNMLFHGFFGYNKLSESELEQEYTDRKLPSRG